MDAEQLRAELERAEPGVCRYAVVGKALRLADALPPPESHLLTQVRDVCAVSVEEWVDIWRRHMEQAHPPQPQTTGIQLNAEQRAAVKALHEFLESDQQFFGLFGYAGTGKTTVIQHVFEKSRLRVAMSAPTHKAVGVLAGMAAERGLHQVDFATIHRLCNVRKTYRDGEIVFLPKAGEEPAITGYDVVVIDECSMISSDMWGWITSAVAQPSFPVVSVGSVAPRRTKIIVMGDPAQLPPVKEESSPTFDLPHVQLSQVMRNKGCIQAASTAIRLAIDAKRPPLAMDGADEHGEVVNLDHEAWLERFIAATHRPNTKALAFTNDAVDWLNDWVREQRFGADAPAFVPGERLVLVETYEINGLTTLHTESELEVVEASPASRLGLPCWKLKVTCDGAQHTIYALDDGQREAWSDLMRDARSRGKAGKGWQQYYQLVEAFARVRPGWATTIHKSQGSTYDEVYLVQTNVLGAGKSDPSFRNMLLYVGYSRARRGLYLS